MSFAVRLLPSEGGGKKLYLVTLDGKRWYRVRSSNEPGLEDVPLLASRIEQLRAWERELRITLHVAA